MSTSNTATASAVAQNHELSHCCICGDALGSNRISNNHTRLQKKLSRKRNTKPITRKDYTLPCSKTECVEMYFQQPVENNGLALPKRASVTSWLSWLERVCAYPQRWTMIQTEICSPLITNALLNQRVLPKGTQNCLSNGVFPLLGCFLTSGRGISPQRHTLPQKS